MVSYLGVVRTVMMADTAQFNRAVSGASSNFRAAAQQMRHDAQSLVGIGGALNLGITIPALFAARSITRLGVEYEANMLKIRQTVSMTRKELDALNRTQMQLSRDAKTSPLDLAKIGYIASQAQFRSPRAIHQIQKAVTMSQRVQPGDASFEEVTTGLTKVMNAFQFSSKNAIQVVAEMNKTIRLGQLSWREYNKNVTQAAAIFSTLGEKQKSFKDMNIAVALATQGGVQGGASFTALRNLITRIYKEGRKDKSELNIAARGMGYKGIVHMFETGAGSSLTGLMQMLQAKYGTGETATGAGFMQRELAAALKLMNADIHEWRRYEAEYGNALSGFKADYEEALKSPLAIMDGVRAAFDRVKLSFFGAVGPTILSFLERLVGVLEKLSQMPDASKKLLAFLVVLASVASALTGVIGVIKTVMLSKHLGLLQQGVKGVTDLNELYRQEQVARSAAERAEAERAALRSRREIANTLRAEATQKMAEFRLSAAMSKEKEREAAAALKAQVAVARATAAMAKAQQQAAAVAAKAAATAAKTAVQGEVIAQQVIKEQMKQLPLMAATTQAMIARLTAIYNQLYMDLFGGTPTNRLLGNQSDGAPPLFRGMVRGASGRFSHGVYQPRTVSGRFLPIPHHPVGGRSTQFSLPYYSGPMGRTPSQQMGLATVPAGALRGKSVFNMDGAIPAGALMPISGGALIRHPRGGVIDIEATEGPPIKDGAKPPKAMGGMWKDIGTGLVMMAKWAIVMYVVKIAFTAIADVLEVTLIPALRDMGLDFKNLGELFATITDILTIFVAVGFATAAGVLENALGVLISGFMSLGSAAHTLVAEIWQALGNLIDWVRNSWLGRRFGWSKSEEETAAGKKWRGEWVASARSGWEDWATYGKEQFVGMFGIGPGSAVVRNIKAYTARKYGADTNLLNGDPNAKRGFKFTPIFGRPLAEDREDPTEAFVKELFGVGGAAGLFEAGTASGYEALVTANDALLQMMREFKDKNIEKLGTISDGLGEIAATLEEIGIDGDITVEGAV